MSKFAFSPKDLYLPCGDFESYTHNVDVTHHVAFSYTMSDNLRDTLDNCDNDYSFLRIGRCDSLPTETNDLVCLMAQILTNSSTYTSTRDTDFSRDSVPPTYCEYLVESDNHYVTAIASRFDGDDLVSSDCPQSVSPTALVAHVSYASGHDSNNWILDSGSTHHMNGFANDFLDAVGRL